MCSSGRVALEDAAPVGIAVGLAAGLASPGTLICRRGRSRFDLGGVAARALVNCNPAGSAAFRDIAIFLGSLEVILLLPNVAANENQKQQKKKNKKHENCKKASKSSVSVMLAIIKNEGPLWQKCLCQKLHWFEP